MWLVLESGGSLKRQLRFGIFMFSLEVLLLRITLAGLRGVILDVQTLWQAHYFVGLEVQTSWQAQRFVSLEVQVSWPAQDFV